MGLFSRIAAIVRGFFSKTVNEIEHKNPDILLDDLRIKIEKTGREAERQIIDIQTNAELIRMEMNSTKKDLEQVKSRIELARDKGDAELLAELLMQEEDISVEYELNKEMYERAMLEIARIRQDYKLFESEMNARFRELKTLKSQARIAALKENIITLNSNYLAKNRTMEKVNSSMDRARQVVNIKTARATVIENLNNDNVDTRIRRLDMETRKEKALLRAQQLIETKGNDTIQTS